MVVAHAGGVDEILLLVGPVIAFTVCRRLARGARAETPAGAAARKKPVKRRR